MVAMWKRMREYFGQSWVREYSDVNGYAIKTWTEVLAPFSEEQIARGVKACQDWTGAFPPTVAQFKALCLTVRNHEKPNFTDRRIESEKDEIKALDDFTKIRKTDGPVAQREKKRIARLLAGEDIESREESFTNLGLRRRWQR